MRIKSDQIRYIRAWYEAARDGQQVDFREIDLGRDTILRMKMIASMNPSLCLPK